MKQVCELLIIDDDVKQLHLLEHLQKELGLSHRYSYVADGEAALNYLHQRAPYADAVRPDLILLHLNFPGRSGHEVLRDIKADPVLRMIPVIIVSASTSESDIVKSYGGFANAYISKPLDLEQNLNVVKSIENFWVRTALLAYSNASCG